MSAPVVPSPPVRILSTHRMLGANRFGRGERLCAVLRAEDGLVTRQALAAAQGSLGLTEAPLRGLGGTDPAVRAWLQVAALAEAWQLAEGGPPFRRAAHAHRRPGGEMVIAFGCAHPRLAQLGLRAVLAAISGGGDAEVDAEEARAAARLRRISFSGRSLALAALRRGLAPRPEGGGRIVAGEGAAARGFRDAMTDDTSHLAVRLAADKLATKQRLRAEDIPTPPALPVADAEQAAEAARRLGGLVVVKPRFGATGRGVRFAKAGSDQVRQAYEAARREGLDVLAEAAVPGDDYRLLVVGGRLRAAALRSPPTVIGDGASTVRQLIGALNADPRRGLAHTAPLAQVGLDDEVEQVLAEQGLGLQACPASGQAVRLRRAANLSTGSTATDVTDLVHPAIAAVAESAALAIGLDVAGVDIVTSDLSRPLEETGGGVIEVNAAPGLRAHLQPLLGRRRNVAAAILDHLFRDPGGGRAPVWLVLDQPQAQLARSAAGALRRRGVRAAAATSRWTAFAGREDISGPLAHPGLILQARTTEAAVVGLSAAECFELGLGVTHAEAAVVLKSGFRDGAFADTPQASARVRTVLGLLEQVLAHEGVLIAEDSLRPFFRRTPDRTVWLAPGPVRDIRVRAHAALLAHGPRTVGPRRTFTGRERA